MNICPTCQLRNPPDKFSCDFCGECCGELYEGWCFTSARLNPFAKGTADSGLMQKRVFCEPCSILLQKNGLRPK